MCASSCVCLAAGRANAQSFSSPSTKPKPWSRVSFFANGSQTSASDGLTTDFTELSTSFTYQLPETDDDGLDYGADIRYATYAAQSRPNRASVYEGFVGARLNGGAIRFRLGHMWLNDLGSLGSVAGGMFELRQKRRQPEDGRLRAGVFAGLEPDILDAGYAPNVRKFGAYVTYEGRAARRNSLGYVVVRDASLTERSVLTTTNFIPVGHKIFVYQAAEYDVQSPAGQGRKGLSYFFGNARITPNDRVEFQASYNRGRSVDVRSLSEDVLAGRAVTQQSIEGLLYESIGGRATVEVVHRVRVYAGYSRDRNNRDAEATGRTLVGAYASNVANSGFDVTASDNLIERPQGQSYHSRYVSLGRQLGRGVYVYGDYSTSLSVIRFSRSDGIIVETHPQTDRFSGTATINVGRSVSVLATLERTNDDTSHTFRVLSGITYRIQ